MSMRYLAVVTLFCALLIFSSVQSTSAEPSALKFDETHSGPYVDKVLYKIISNENNRVQALLADEIDILDGPIIDSAHLSTLDADPDIELSSMLRNGYGHITINCRDNPLNYSVLRRAFAYAFDKTEVPAIVDGVDQMHDSLVPYVSTFCYENELDWHYYTNESVLANQMLDDAGFSIDGGTGFRLTPFGDPFDIVIEYGASSPEIGGGIAQLAVDALTTLHIDSSTSATDFNEYMSRIQNHGSYDMVFYAVNFYSDDVDWLASEYYSANADVPYQNPTNFINATFDAFRAPLLYGSTYDEVYNASREMQKILHYNVPRLVVYENTYYSAYRTNRFEGHVFDVSKNVENEWTNLKARLKLLEGGPFSGTLRVSMGQEPDSFNPFTTNSAYSKTIFDNLFDSLVRTGPDGSKVPSLATSYTKETHDDNVAVPTGHTRFTFDIIQNASWSDGTPLTAEDVAYTFSYLYDSMAYGNPMGIGLTDLVAAYTPLPSIVIMEFSTESYWHLSTISELPILQKTLLQGIGASGWNTWNPIFSSDPYPTSGPFNITDQSAGSYVELSYRPDFQYRVRGTGSDLPVVDDPDDMLVVYGGTGYSISWNIIDDNPLVYRLYNNGSLITADYYTSSPIVLDIDSQLSTLGSYNFTIQVQDWEYQSVVDSVFVELVPDTFDPVVNGSNDFSILNVLSSGTMASWTVFDDNPANYTILLDDVEVNTLSWTSDDSLISHDIGTLTAGVYNFTIVLRDQYGHNATDSVIVTVFSDTTSPGIVGPDDIDMTVRYTGLNILWNATDDYPDTYSIYLDATVVATGSWEQDIPIVFNLDDLDIGEYNFTIYVYDLSANMFSDTVSVSVSARGFPVDTMMLLGIVGVGGIVVVLVIVVKAKGAR